MITLKLLALAFLILMVLKFLIADSQRFRFISDLDEIGDYEVFYQDPEKGTVSEKPKAQR